MRSSIKSSRVVALVMLYVLFLGLIIKIGVGEPTTVWDSDGSAASVQSIHDNQAVDGDTIRLPVGSFTWAQKVIITKGVIIKPAASTTVTSNVGSETILEFQTADKPASLYRGTWNGYVGTASGNSGIVVVRYSTNVRIHHAVFNLQHSGVATYASEPVIDHCTFNKPVGAGSVTGVRPFGDGDNSWNEALSLGTEHAVYIEDCTFNFPSNANGAVDMYNGARVVFRKNTVTNTTFGTHGLDSGSYRSGLSWEVYYNNFTITAGYSQARLISLRGGTGVVFKNTVTVDGSLSSDYIVLQCYRATGPCIFNEYVPWGFIDGVNPYDGNQDNGWPALDQIGAAPPTEFFSDHSEQGSQPAYAWQNTIDGAPFLMAVDDCEDCAECPDGSAGHPNPLNMIQEGRDFFNIKMPGYVPYTYPHPRTATP